MVESPIAVFCLPERGERDALRAVFRSKGYRRVWIIAGSDQANTYYFAEGPPDSDEQRTAMCLALTEVVPGRKAEISPFELMESTTSELFMDDTAD